MAYNNTITITGNLCADCEIYKDKVVKCRVAVNKRGNSDIPPLYLNVSLFTDNDDVLDRCYNYLRKGSCVEVTGELSISTYEDSNGLERTNVSIIASEIKKISGVYLPIRKPAAQDEDKPARSRKPAAQDEDKPARSRKPAAQDEDKPAAQDEDKPARSRKPAAQDEDKPARSRKPRLQEFDDDDGEIPF